MRSVPVAEPSPPALSPAYDCDPLAPDEDDESVIAYNLDGLMVRRVRFGRMRFTRTRATLRATDIDGLVIARYLSGSIRGRIGDHELRKAPNQISLEDLTVPCEGLAEPSEVLSVIIPRDRVPSSERLGPRRPVHSLPLNGAAGALVAATLRSLWNSLRAGQVYEPTVAAGAFLGLVNGLIEHDVEPPGVRDPGALMEQYLRQRLADPTLGPEHLQQAFNYSRSAVYRLFEHHGGVAAFIRAERLGRCHAELIRSTTPRAVSAVAARYGFYDASHFSRVFRQRYGIPPSQLVDAVTSRAADSPAPRASGPGTLGSWLED